VDSQRVDSQRVDSQRVDSQRVDSHRVDSHRVDSQRVDSHRVDSQRVEGNDSCFLYVFIITYKIGLQKQQFKLLLFNTLEFRCAVHLAISQ